MSLVLVLGTVFEFNSLTNERIIHTKSKSTCNNRKVKFNEEKSFVVWL